MNFASNRPVNNDWDNKLIRRALTEVINLERNGLLFSYTVTQTDFLWAPFVFTPSHLLALSFHNAQFWFTPQNSLSLCVNWSVVDSFRPSSFLWSAHYQPLFISIWEVVRWMAVEVNSIMTLEHEVLQLYAAFSTTRRSLKWRHHLCRCLLHVFGVFMVWDENGSH